MWHIVGHIKLVGEFDPRAVLGAIGHHLAGVVLQELELAGLGADNCLPARIARGAEVATLVVAPGARPQR